MSSYDERNYLFQMELCGSGTIVAGTLVNLFQKESIIEFFSLQACVTTETKRERKNINNIFLHTVINLTFIIVFGRWFIDLRGEIKQQGTDKI